MAVNVPHGHDDTEIVERRSAGRIFAGTDMTLASVCSCITVVTVALKLVVRSFNVSLAFKL